MSWICKYHLLLPRVLHSLTSALQYLQNLSHHPSILNTLPLSWIAVPQRDSWPWKSLGMFCYTCFFFWRFLVYSWWSPLDASCVCIAVVQNFPGALMSTDSQVLLARPCRSISEQWLFMAQNLDLPESLLTQILPYGLLSVIIIFRENSAYMLQSWHFPLFVFFRSSTSSATRWPWSTWIPADGVHQPAGKALYTTGSRRATVFL